MATGLRTTGLKSVGRVLRRERQAPPEVPVADLAPAATEPEAETPLVEIAANDPIIAYFQSAQGPVEVEGMELDSPALEALKAAGVKLVVPLVSQGELIGVLNLGPRLSEQEYTGDDRKLLDNLAAQAAPAVRVGQLVREQEAEVRARARIDQELKVAHLIQQNFLPKQLPELPGWQVAAYYRPAREVGGDFYDFIELSDDRLGIVIGDVTDKGVPAAMVMAATRSVLRASVQRAMSPGEVLGRVNDLMCPDMPEKMFVTCFYAVLERQTGRLSYANAGHDVPYMSTGGEVAELRARGMPLGLMPGSFYEEDEAVIGPGESALLYSDGLAEAHDPAPAREMFGFPRVKALVGGGSGGQELIDVLLSELDRFTGSGWEQEDDITIVTVERSAHAGIATNSSTPGAEAATPRPASSANGGARTLAEFTVASEPGNERLAIARVEEAVAELYLPGARLDRLKTAVGETTMNAMEHGNEYRPDLPVSIMVLASDARVWVRVTDKGGDRPIPEAETPDIEAKLEGKQTPRGWGLFLIEKMVDELQVTSDDHHHTVELCLDRKGDDDGNT